MKFNLKKIIKPIIFSFLCVGILSSVITFSIINSSSNTSNLFAEIIVSDNTSILSDKSFSESAFNGYRKFLNSKKINELDKSPSSFREGFGLWRRPGNTVLDREITFKGTFANGKNLIIAPGFNHADAVNNVLKDKNYNNKGFLLLDSNINTTLTPGNAATVTFRMEQAGFQVGVAASEFIFVNKDIFGKDGSLKIGGFVGIPFPSTTDFLVGFQKGMVSWNEINKSRIGFQKIEWITLGNNIGNYASGTFGVGDGKEITGRLLKEEADMIMPIAGPQTLDVVQQIQSNNRPVGIIGVDSPQENNFNLNQPMPNLNSLKIKRVDGTNSENQNIIQFSAEKKLDIAINGILQSIFDKENPNEPNTLSDAFGGFGYHNISTIGIDGSGAVGISENGKDYFTRGLGHETYELAVKSLETNLIFQEMISKKNVEPEKIKFYNTSNGLAPLGGEFVDIPVKQYDNGLINKLEIIGPKNVDGTPDKNKWLNGSNWEIVG